MRHGHAKGFHVSPFVGMQADYRFRFTRTRDESSVVIHEYQDQQLMLVAVQRGTLSAITDTNLLRAAFACPLLTLKVVALIHWHAVKIGCAARPITLNQRRPGRRLPNVCGGNTRLPVRGRPGPAVAVARLFGRFCRHLAFGSLVLRYPDGRADLYRGRFDGPAGELVVDRPWRCVRRLFTRGEIGFAEAFIEGQWHTPDLPALLDLLQLNIEHLGAGPKGLAWSRWFNRLTHRLRDNHPRNSRRNIAAPLRPRQ